MNRHSFFLEIALDYMTFLTYLQHTFNAETHNFWELIHFEEELFNTLREE